MQELGKAILDAVEEGLEARHELRKARHTDAERERVRRTEAQLGELIAQLINKEEVQE